MIKWLNYNNEREKIDQWNLWQTQTITIDWIEFMKKRYHYNESTWMDYNEWHADAEEMNRVEFKDWVDCSNNVIPNIAT